MFYYKVVPFARIPLSSPQAFTYHSSQIIPLGSLVEISIARKKRKGVVIQKTTRPPFQTKAVSGILHEQILSQKQLALAKEISQYYLTSLGVVLKFFVPKISKKKSRPQTSGPYSKSKAPEPTTAQKAAVKKILSLSGQKSALLFGPASSGKTEVVIRVAEKIIKSGGQILVLIPELFLSEQEIERYTARLGKHGIAFYNSGCKPSEIRHIYEGVRDKKIKIVIATRAGLFLPFSRLGLIVIDEEQDPSFKQWDQMPHYHTRETAVLLRKQHNATLVCCSATPSLETIKKTKSRKVSLVKLPALKTKEVVVKKPHIEIIDAYKNFNKKYPFVFSKELEKSLDEVLEKNRIGLLLVPRRGKSSALLCSDCKHVQRCPACEAPLVHLGDTYKCLHCSHKTNSFSRCSKCQSLRIVDVGFGTERVADFLKTFYPQACISRADAATLTNKKARSELYKKIKNNKIDFIVGTYAIAKGFDIPHVELVAIVNSDNWAGKTDFRFDERWMRNLFQLAGRLNRPGSSQDGKFLVQTYLPKKNFDHLLRWNWQRLCDDELPDRKALGYPPYGKMIKLTYKNQSPKDVEKKVNVLYNWFLEAVKPKKIKVSEPFWGNLRKTRNKNQKHLLLTFSGQLPAPTLAKLKKLPAGWTIDVDPEFLF